MKKYCWFIVFLVLCSCGLKVKNGVKEKDTLTSFIENKVLTNEWTSTDAVGKPYEGGTHYAALMSSNTITQRFPYGETNSVITIKNTKDGNKVIILVNHGQIYGDYIEVRFGDDNIKKYTFSMFQDSSFVKLKTIPLNKITLDNADDFIEECKSHKSIKIRIPLFREGKRVFKYNADTLLNWKW